MPRDRKGQPFGIDTIVTTPVGKMHVCGFSVNNTPLDREQIRGMAAVSCASCAHEPTVFYWHEVEVVDPEKNPYSKHDDHTDTCHADIAQRDGVDLTGLNPVMIQQALEQYSPEAGMACKAVWGGSMLR